MPSHGLSSDKPTARSNSSLPFCPVLGVHSTIRAKAGQLSTGVDSAQPEDIVYELLLKFGQPLTTLIETLDITGARVFTINGRKMLFVLETFTVDMIEPLLALKPREIIALDSVFHKSDDLKSNLDLQCRDAKVRFTCI
jgi:hypothetical protein